VDEDRIGAMGMSQGGGIAIWLGAFWPRVRVVAADLPFLAGTSATGVRGAYRYPLKELADWADRETLGEQRISHTLSYFDTAHLATRCGVPTLVSAGLQDPAVRPASVRAVYEALPGHRHLVEYPGGHDWDPGMVDNNRAWLERGMG